MARAETLNRPVIIVYLHKTHFEDTKFYETDTDLQTLQQWFFRTPSDSEGD